MKRIGGIPGKEITFYPWANDEYKGRAYNDASDAKVRSQLADVDGVEIVQTGVIPVKMPPSGYDVYIWGFVICIGTALILFLGRYQFIEKTVVILVVGFTLLSVLNFVLLQQNPTWSVSPGDFVQGLKFQLPPKVEGVYPLATALAAFGIIGMAAGELIFYPYWCLEKGYAKHVGPRDNTAAWETRAHGWIQVMKFDAWGSMAIYTVSTVVFSESAEGEGGACTVTPCTEHFAWYCRFCPLFFSVSFRNPRRGLFLPGCYKR